jgi:hypothetical protein
MWQLGQLGLRALCRFLLQQHLFIVKFQHQCKLGSHCLLPIQGLQQLLDSSQLREGQPNGITLTCKGGSSSSSSNHGSRV